MTARSAPSRVLVFASDEPAPGLPDALAALPGEARSVTDVFDGMAVVTDAEPDAVILDLTMSRDDARVLAYWLRDHDVTASVVGVVEPLSGAADAELDDLCDELVLTPVTAATLAAALGLDAPATEPGRRLTVKVNAELLDAHDVSVPPERARTGDDHRPALVVGLGAHAEAPRHND